ncbi:hypothetical protein [Hydrogenophaga sp. 5NK40-0174]|uniref:hypothetical protein n=1 Tax=Hydrogenophaga sp. 5NK40-0174 TaxID=3127649 RepID=UPI003104C893
MKRSTTVTLAARRPRNPVTVALAQRASSGAGGKHEKPESARRRAEKIALRKEWRFGNDQL